VAIRLGKNRNECFFTYPYIDQAKVMHGWLTTNRLRLSKAQYSLLLGKAIMTELYVTQLSWNIYDRCFVNDPKTDIKEHTVVLFESSEAIKKDLKDEKCAIISLTNEFEKINALTSVNRKNINQTECDLWNQCLIIGGVDMAGIAEIVRNASMGNNQSVEELEFSCVCYNSLEIAMTMWASLGRRGRDRVTAYKELLYFSYCDDSGRRSLNELLSTYDGAQLCFRESIGALMGGSAQMNVRGGYIPLPPLW
jgi:hypothetical protein